MHHKAAVVSYLEHVFVVPSLTPVISGLKKTRQTACVKKGNACFCSRKLFLFKLPFWTLALWEEVFAGRLLGATLGAGPVSALVLRRSSCVPAGLRSAAGVPRPDAGAGPVSEGHGAGAPQTPVPEAGGAAVLHRSSHEAVPASLSAGTEVKARRGCETRSGEREGSQGPRPAD